MEGMFRRDAFLSATVTPGGIFDPARQKVVERSAGGLSDGKIGTLDLGKEELVELLGVLLDALVQTQ